jgi:predicted DNA binding CopG/RHH family protein
MKNKLPKFKSEKEERLFWEENDSSDFIDWNKAEKVILPKLKPSVKSISIRLPEIMLNQIKVIANKKDVPYQSFIKTILSEKIQQELHTNIF